MKRSVISSERVRRRCVPCAKRVSKLSGFLLRHGRHYHRPAWTQLHRRWLASLKFDQAVHHIVLEDCIAAVEAATARRDQLEAHIEAVLPEWSLAPVVEALQALRGVRLPGFNQSSQRLYVLVVSVRQMPLQVFSSQEFCEALC
jgi:hypothetical protein